jgi:hypothetical protein
MKYLWFAFLVIEDCSTAIFIRQCVAASAKVIGMSTIQVWVYDKQLEELKKLIEIYEQRQDDAFRGKSFSWDHKGGRRHKTRREKINKDYVIREAIDCLMSETEQRLFLEKQEREKMAEYTKIVYPEPEKAEKIHRWGKRSQVQEPAKTENRSGNSSQGRVWPRRSEPGKSEEGRANY